MGLVQRAPNADFRCARGGWRAELATCRKFAPAARSYAAARLMAETGLRVNEASHLDLADVKWDLGRFGHAKKTGTIFRDPTRGVHDGQRPLNLI